MNYSDFIYDFNLYLCERFGYRNCCSVMHNANGICVSVHVGEMDLYIRFWEYSCGVGHYPDWSIIIVRSNFKRKHSKKCTFYTLRFGCSFAAVNTIKPQLL